MGALTDLVSGFERMMATQRVALYLGISLRGPVFEKDVHRLVAEVI
jgi:hypothetical protein